MSGAAIRERIVKTVVKSGNGGAVWVPKDWLGEEVVILLPEKPRLGTKERVFRMLEPYLKDIISVGIYGSYARNEQTMQSDLDVLVITTGKALHINAKGMDIVSFPMDKFRIAIEKHPVIYYQMVHEVVPLINADVLDKLKAIVPPKESLKNYLSETQEHLKSNKELLELDKLDGDSITSNSILYSSILRLRGLFIIKCILNKTKFSSKRFKKGVINNGLKNNEFADSIRVFRLIRDNKKAQGISVKTHVAEKLLSILEKELNELEAQVNDQ